MLGTSVLTSFFFSIASSAYCTCVSSCFHPYSSSTVDDAIGKTSSMNKPPGRPCSCAYKCPPWRSASVRLMGKTSFQPSGWEIYHALQSKCEKNLSDTNAAPTDGCDSRSPTHCETYVSTYSLQTNRFVCRSTSEGVANGSAIAKPCKSTARPRQSREGKAATAAAIAPAAAGPAKTSISAATLNSGALEGDFYGTTFH